MKSSSRKPWPRSLASAHCRAAFMAALAWAILLPACGAQSGSVEQHNNGGNTSWLSPCDDSTECGSLICIDNTCTLACRNDSECESLAALASCIDGTCALPEPSDTAEPSVDAEPSATAESSET